MSDLTAKARRRGTFPPLLDRTRTIERPTLFDDPVNAVRTLLGAYRIDPLATQRVLPVIVVEKATLIAQVARWFDDLALPVAALRGYASETFERTLLGWPRTPSTEAAVFCSNARAAAIVVSSP